MISLGMTRRTMAYGNLWKCCWLLVLVACHPGETTPQAPVPKRSDFIACAHEVEFPSISRLIEAYPDHLSHSCDQGIVWKDGTIMPWDDHREKTFEELEQDADLEDMFTFAYPRGVATFQENVDPGRIRNEAFFKKMYGETPAAVEARLAKVDWFGTTLKVTTVNGVDKALVRVALRLKTIPAYKPFLVAPGGGFHWRVIAGTTRLSAHSYGIAVDINTAYADYWRWSKAFQAGKPLEYRNRIPLEIVRIFESEGFIWGGKWYHYDTMHFEYRPELL